MSDARNLGNAIEQALSDNDMDMFRHLLENPAFELTPIVDDAVTQYRDSLMKLKSDVGRAPDFGQIVEILKGNETDASPSYD